MWSDHILKEKEKEKNKSGSMRVLDLFLSTPLMILLFKSFYLMAFISNKHFGFIAASVLYVGWSNLQPISMMYISCHSELKISISNSFNSFFDNELHLLNSCSTVLDNDFEDFQAQATDSATYILWLTKVNYLLSF